jgi:predicted nucleotidyltransferase
MTELDQSAIESIIRWAEKHSDILEVWLFGSRMTGAHDASSDLDVAILLKPGGDARGLYVAKWEEWQKELTELLPFQVDLRASQEDHPSYSELLSGTGRYKGARRFWARVVHSPEDKSPFRRP